MELGSVMVDKLKEAAKSTQLFADGLFRDSARRTPIEILKRLQRESFSDIMKLRDRQEIVEKLLSSFRSSERSPFKEAATHVKGKVDVVGAIFIMDDVDDQKYDAIERSGIRTGIDARLTFGTHVREKDELVAEFVATEKSRGDVLGGGPLSLAKVFYSAHLCSWLSAFAIPIGARYRDIFFGPDPHQERGLTAFSEFGPPLMNQNNGSAIGITASNSKVIASLSQFVSGLGMQVNSAGVCTGIAHSLSTFGLVSFQPTQNTKLSLLGMHRRSRPSGQNVNLGTFAFPIGLFKHNQCPEMSADEDSPTSWERQVSDGSIALIFDSKVDERTRLGGWLETKSSNPRDFQWGVTVRDCDTPEEDFGWGLTVGGLVQDTKNFEHFQVETFLNLNVGSKLKLQPAVLYVKDGATHFPAMMLRSSWHI